MKLLLSAGLLLCSYACATDIPAEFTSAGIVPDVLTKAPSELLSATYKDGDKDKDVHFGEELTPTIVKDPPALSWMSEDSSHYAILMVDPDAPSREDPKFREMLHWLVANVPGSDLNKGEVIAEYAGSAPQKETGLHRYVMLVFKQPDKLTIEEARISNRERTGRPAFSVKAFAAKYKLGDPIAGNMFRAQWDEYVPILRKQMGDES
ncbi:protein D3-like [Phymastichus coffea]|uniref:protein D3-like n=1 Tax=Phymastichus coffea TaxID=108790 RepID=UPI00273BB99D|nr:protein D3-like [Phymastichus coffea]